MSYANSAKELKDYLVTKLEADLNKLRLGLEDSDKDFTDTQLQRGKIKQCRIMIAELNKLQL